MSCDDASSAPNPEVIVPIEEHLDLHPFHPRDVRSVVESYLEAAVDAGFREVRLIHGRGTGVQREIVRSFLARHPSVRGFVDAPPERGGWGATVVSLIPKGGSRFDEEAAVDENGPCPRIP